MSFGIRSLLFSIVLITIGFPIQQIWAGTGNRLRAKQMHSNIGMNSEPSIEGYSDSLSVAPGQTLNLMVSTPRPNFSIDFLKFGDPIPAVVYQVKNVPGALQSYSPYAFRDGANWSQSYSFRIPENWASGIYAAKLYDDCGGIFCVTFIVRPDFTSSSLPSIAVLVPTFTWEAYNSWGGASFYRYFVNDGTGRKVANLISTQRPNPSANPFFSKADHLAAADILLLQWLAKHQYPYSVISDSDLNQDPLVLNRFKVLMIDTHSEYWSPSMVFGLDKFLQNGGSVLSLGGNGIYWAVESEGTQIECHKDKSTAYFSGGIGGLWEAHGDPAARILGSQYTKIVHPAAPYKVLDSNNWVFSGTGLKNGDLIGTTGLNEGGASGWEIDKVDKNSPSNVDILATGTNPGGGADMTYYDNPGGGGVFSVGSIDFVGSLAVDPQLTKIVENVLDRFSGNGMSNRADPHLLEIYNFND